MARLYDRFGILVKTLPPTYDDMPDIRIDERIQREWGIEEPTLEELAEKSYVRRRFTPAGEGVYLEDDDFS